MNELLALLPAALRRQDELLGGPLADLLRLLELPLAHLDEDLAQLHDDLFIETAAEWVLPYLGDLVAHRPLRGPSARLSSPRAEVARTIGYRRRKGTVAVLEQIARDISGFPARAVESWQHLAITQHFLHLRPHRAQAPDLRRGLELRRRATPFDALAHTIDVRPHRPHALPHVRVSLWRLRPLPLRRVTPLAHGGGRFFFSPVGGRVPLFHRPDPAYDGPVLTPEHAPQPITRRELHDRPGAYYSEQGSLAVFIGGAPVPLAAIKAADLSDKTASQWQHAARDGRVLVDPELGRLAIDPDLLKGDPAVEVSFHVGAPGELGGGQYERGRLLPRDIELAPTGDLGKDLQDALEEARGSSDPPPATRVVELAGSGTFGHDGTLRLVLPAGERLVLRAAARERPVLASTSDRPFRLEVAGGPDSELELDGLVVTGQIVVAARIDDDTDSRLRTLTLRHCTLVPGLGRTPDGRPRDPGAASLRVDARTLRLALERSITGPLQLPAGVPSALDRCIVDASDPTRPAYEAAGGGPGGPLSLDRCTVIGTVHAESFDLVTNTIVHARLPAGSSLAGPVVGDRRQIGCVRHSYVPPGSQTPRRFRCPPDPDADPTAVVPRFHALRFGSPLYAVLRPDTPRAIREAADDEAEPGVFHDLFFPHIEANVRARLDEFLPLGLTAELTLVP